MKRRMLYLGAALALVLALTLPAALPVAADPGAISLSKQTIPDAKDYYVGDTIDYELIVSNPNLVATNVVTRIWDTLPNGTVIEFLGLGEELVQLPGESKTFYAQYTVAAADVKWLDGPGFDGVMNTFQAKGFDSAGDDIEALVTRNSRVLERTVGGEGFAGNKAAILARWIALAGLLVGGVAILRRRSAAEMG